jgi:hypothetical protein
MVKATTNIISFSQVEKTPDWFKIEYETGTLFTLVNKVTKRITQFKCDGGLYAFTRKQPKENKAEQAKSAGVNP